MRNSKIKNLNDILQGTYRFYLTAQHYHWNVEGLQFVTLHTLFENLYQDAFGTLDEIAERIRTLDEYVHLPVGNGIETEVVGDSAEERSRAMIENLVVLNKELLTTLKAAIDSDEISDDPVTEDLLIGRMNTHSKNIWILNSLLKW